LPRQPADPVGRGEEARGRARRADLRAQQKRGAPDPGRRGIVAQAQKVLEQAQGIRELAQAGKNQLTAPLKVGAIYTVGPYLFPHLIPQLHRVAPQMPLYIEENFTHVLRDKLRNGELDAVIIALPFNEADVLTLPLYDEPFCA
jgi:LysR family hydrogen peroxide-inducible transcriptional activator